MRNDDSDPTASRSHPARAPRSVSPSRDRFKQRTVFSLSEAETQEFGRVFAGQLKGGELIIVEGQLGMGKTVFARGVAEGLEIRPEEVSSPSYALIHEYLGGRLSMYHVDLYRLERPEETETLGIDELLSLGGIVLAEWGERLPAFFRRDAVLIRFYDIGEGSRRIEVMPAEGHEARPPSDA